MILFFATHSEACGWMQHYNRFVRGKDSDVIVVVDGPEDNYAVIDLESAIEMEVPYEWAI
jgi:hypothetical protein